MRFDQWIELVCVVLALADVAFGASLICWALFAKEHDVTRNEADS